ncbi:hypothetical protein [Hymenobacter negativus]|uniref:Uncharacterized protein n=1 Tax=Hymenobacter negativus TaxID=2795026 RepID=A0ABS3QHJ4_9BACT|nr:hypothetical protein [Hymenobacter negativus]MBO2010706.1 hypothetical protein [Hymenobacter negativus]
MKALLILGLAVLLAVVVRLVGQRTAAPGAAFAERLYRARLLTAAGRDELLRQMRQNELKFEQTDPLTHRSQEHYGTNRASILNFCAEAFQTEFNYRQLGIADDLLLAEDDQFIAGSSGQPTEQGRAPRVRYQEALKRFGGDTSALLRWYYDQQPARLKIEYAIPAEDSMPQGWTIYPPLAGPSGAKGLHHWIDERRSILGKTRSRTARDLLAVGLLDQAAYQQLQQAMDQGGFMSEMQVCQAAASIMQRRETHTQDQARQQQWLRQLEQAGQLSPAQCQRLTQESRPYEVRDLFNVVGYCEHARIVDLRPLPHAPQQLYPLLFKEIQAVLPDFHYTYLSLRLSVEDEGSDLLDQNITLSFRANGRRYETTFLHDYLRRDGSDPNPDAWPGVSENFHKSINQWLTDRHSPLRLYQAWTPDASSPHGNEKLGLLAMTQTQRKLWGNEHSFSLFSTESYDTRFSSAAIERLVADYQKLGLFAHLSTADIARGQAAALSGAKTSYAEVLLSFPHVIYAFDWESANPPYPYAALTRELVAISRGGFAPTLVQDGFGADYPTTPTVPFSFQLNQRRYHTPLPVRSDWLAAESVELMQQALREQHAPGQFYSCLDGEGYIYLTPAQYQALNKAQPELFKTPIEEAEGEPAF